MDKPTEGMEYVADVRVGIVAVHWNAPGSKFNCLDGMRDQCIFWANGFRVEKENGDFDHWDVRPEDVAMAQLIAAAVNACKKVNEHDPLAVANQIEAAFKALELMSERMKEIEYKYPITLELPRVHIDAILSAAKEV